MHEQQAHHQQSHLPSHFRLLPVSGIRSLHLLTHWDGMEDTAAATEPRLRGPSHLESNTAVQELHLHGDYHWDALILQERPQTVEH